MELGHSRNSLICNLPLLPTQVGIVMYLIYNDIGPNHLLVVFSFNIESAIQQCLQTSNNTHQHLFSVLIFVCEVSK